MNSQHRQLGGGWRISEYMLMILLVHSEMFMLPYNNKFARVMRTLCLAGVHEIDNVRAVIN